MQLITLFDAIIAYYNIVNLHNNVHTILNVKNVI